MAGFFKTSYLSAIGVLVRLFCLFITNKVVALYLGPSGLFVLGQLQNLIQVLVSFSGGSLSTGVTKKISESEMSWGEKSLYISNAFKLSVVLYILVSIAFFIYSAELSSILFGSDKYRNVLLFTIIGAAGGTVTTLILAILNGHRMMSAYTVLIIAIAVSASVFTSVFTILYGVYGAMMGFAFAQFLSLLLGIWIYMRYTNGTIRDVSLPIKSFHLRELLKYSSLALVTALLLPVGHTLARTTLLGQGGEELAGMWEALNRFSNAYLLFITTTLSVYFLPKFSGEKYLAERRKVLLKASVVVLLVFPVFAFFLILFSDEIVVLIYSKKFLAITDFVQIQIVGDFFKVLSILFVYYLVSIGEMRVLIFAEIVHMSVFLGVINSVENSNLDGVTIAHALSYFVYFALLFGAVIMATKKRSNS